MEEKKLTDEEIVKALKQCTINYPSCEGCPLYNDINCATKASENALDLIHRLQSENERLNDMKFTQEHCDLYKENEWLKAELKRELAEHEEFTKQAKAEIERLTEEHERIAWSKQQYLDWVHGFLYTHTDMKDRGEKFKMFDRDWMCGVFWEKIEGSIEYIIDLENQRNELQKQVDELKEQRDVFKKLFEACNNSSITTEEIINTMNSFYREQAEHLAELKIEQAVKDTAKEILNDLRNIFIEQSSYGCDANQHIGYYDYVVKIGLVIEQVEEYAKLKYGIEYGVEVE